MRGFKQKLAVNIPKKR